jgi:hypothetical protein
MVHQNNMGVGSAVLEALLRLLIKGAMVRALIIFGSPQTQRKNGETDNQG